MKDVFNIWHTSTIHFSNLHGISLRFCFCPPNSILGITKWNDDGTGDSQKGRKYSRDKANIDNLEVNIGCPPLTANRTSADCVEHTPGPSVQRIPLGVSNTGCFYFLYIECLYWMYNQPALIWLALSAGIKVKTIWLKVPLLFMYVE